MVRIDAPAATAHARSKSFCGLFFADAGDGKESGNTSKLAIGGLLR
jgi:hypothetical protein